MICKYFFSCYRLSCHFLENVLSCTKMFNSDEVQCNYFVFCCFCFQCQVIHFQIQDLEDFLLISSESFIVFLLYLDPCLVHFCLWSEEEVEFHLFVCVYTVVPAPFMKKLFFTYDMVFALLLKTNWL